ncbi:hypothetical protein K501DRAFT_269466 [Backusella circina FSU 941]|nr:hypothetical protein K501DRAFT_269466 [Backusella circina FSU 941]
MNMDFFRRFYTGNETKKDHRNSHKLNEKSSVDFHKISNKLNRISTEKKKLIPSKIDEKVPFTQQSNNAKAIKEQLWSLQSGITDEKQNPFLISNTYLNKQEKLRSDDSINIDEENNQSTLYTPFIERPEIVDQDYIRLPTTKKSYIDPPVDDIMDSISTLPYRFRERKRSQKRMLRPEDISPSRDMKSRLDESPFEKQLELLNSQRHNTHQLSPSIDNWLSSTLKQTEPLDINNFDEFGNLKAER